ncbi:MAG: LPXTG cell wall anchor domain-containing protein [Thermomicrobiales bacterium]|nr:LPXTG cell wall anchor domain-containing protein [Thermomicrobiales bacterium]
MGGTTAYADDGDDQSVNNGEVTTGDEGTGGEEGTGENDGSGGDEGSGDDDGSGGDEGSGDDEEVNAAADANISIFSNVDGAVFQVRYWTPPTCGNLHDGPETTSGGSATFTIDTAGTYCFELVSPPPGYQLSGNSVGHFANGYIVKSYAEIASGWSVTFEPIPTRQFTIFTNVDGAVFDVLAYTGSSCVGIDPTNFPGLTGVTVNGGSQELTVPAGAICLVLVSPPAAHQLSGDSVFHFQNNNTLSNITGASWSVVFEPIPTRQFTLRTFNATTSPNVPMDGAVYNILDANGNAIDPTNFPGLTNVTTTGGSTVLTVPDAPIRIQLVSSPTYFTLTGDSVFHFQTNSMTSATSASDWSVLFARESRQFTLRSFDATTGSNVAMDGAVYTILDSAGNAIDASVFPGLTNVGTSGGSVVLTVPNQSIRIQLVSPPTNFVLTGDSVFHFQNGNLTDPIGTGTGDWSVLFRQVTGDFTLVKRFCRVANPDDARVHYSSEFSYDANCFVGPASFTISHNGSVIGTYSTTEGGYLYLTDLPVGDYTIQEIGDSTVYGFTIVAAQMSYLYVTNYVYISGQVEVTKYYCLAKERGTVIEVDYPISPAGGEGGGHAHDCRLGKADFEIWVYGDDESVIPFRTGKDGVAWITLPVTNDVTGPHTIVEVDTGATEDFWVNENEMTEITVWNYVTKKPHKPHKPQKPGGVEVNTLPNTGTGTTSNGNALFLLAGSMVLFGLGAATTRRRWMH